MLRLLSLAQQFSELERDLPEGWSEARFELTVADDALAERAAAQLGPSNPGRLGRMIRFGVGRRGAGIGPEAARRLLKRLDDERIEGELRLLGAQEASPQEVRRRETLREQWERALAALPSDWSDIYGEVQLDSTDYVERAALLLAPLNPARYENTTTLRFRCAHHFGYGVSPEMAARCFERCDAERITGEVRLLHVLSDTHPVGTQGPVWLVGGKAV
jgi:hypothetical protein